MSIKCSVCGRLLLPVGNTGDRWKHDPRDRKKKLRPYEQWPCFQNAKPRKKKQHPKEPAK